MSLPSWGPPRGFLWASWGLLGPLGGLWGLVAGRRDGACVTEKRARLYVAFAHREVDIEEVEDDEEVRMEAGDGERTGEVEDVRIAPTRQCG